jgi:hypothetical protein
MVGSRSEGQGVDGDVAVAPAVLVAAVSDGLGAAVSDGRVMAVSDVASRVARPSRMPKYQYAAAASASSRSSGRSHRPAPPRLSSTRISAIVSPPWWFVQVPARGACKGGAMCVGTPSARCRGERERTGITRDGSLPSR